MASCKSFNSGARPASILSPPNGKASFDVLKMARQGLMLPLRAVINKAKKENKTARRENVGVGQNGNTRIVNIEVVPLKNLRERHFLILFEDAEKSVPAADISSRKRTDASAKVSRSAGKAEFASLERELAEMRDYLQSVLEQHDAANEELQASNEEVQSANEELQSINEELETSKEELESANEELTTVNEEMANRNTELNRLNSDLVNLQTSTKLAILLLGRDLTIRRFSAQAEREFNLLPTDIGKSIARVRHGLNLVDLAEWIEDVIAKLHESEREVRDKDGRWYLLRARPYLTVDNKVDGAVLVLVNIDELKRNEQMANESEEKYRTLVAQVTDYAIFRVDPTGRATTWNEGVKRILGFDKDEFVGKDIVPTIFTPEDVRQGVADRELRQAASEGSASDDRWLQRKDGTRFFAAGITSALTDDTGSVVGYTKIFRDTTEQKRAEERLRDSETRLATDLVAMQSLQHVSLALVGEHAAETLYARIVEVAASLMGSDAASIQIFDDEAGKLRLLAHQGFHKDSAAFWESVRADTGSSCGRALKAGARILVSDMNTFDGDPADVDAYRRSGLLSVQSTPLCARGGHIVGMLSTHWRDRHEFNEADFRFFDVLARLAADLIDRLQTSDQLRQAEERYRTLFDLGPVAVYSCDASGEIRQFNRRAAELWGREPVAGDTDERFCGSYKLFRPDGSFMPHEQCPMAEVLSGKISEARDVEVLIERPDGSRVVVIVNIRPLQSPRGDVTGAINCFYDITERKQAEQRQELLVDELNHRVKNTLASVQSIAAQSLKNASDGEHRKLFEQRLIALSRTHDLLSQDHWMSASLRDVLLQELKPYRTGTEARFEVDGPDFLLEPKAALALAMAFHELATNAAKYGALSKPEGQVRVEWEVVKASEPSALRLKWTETGGPAVKKRERKGFGSTVIERGLMLELEAEVQLDFNPSGLVCLIEIPLPAAGGGGGNS